MILWDEIQKPGVMLNYVKFRQLALRDVTAWRMWCDFTARGMTSHHVVWRHMNDFLISAGGADDQLEFAGYKQ